MSILLAVGVDFAMLPVFASAPAAPKVSWGYPDQPWGRRRPITAADRAQIASYRSSQKPAVYAANFADPSELTSKWIAQSDDRKNLKSCRRPDNVVIENGQLKLKTLAAKDCQTQYSTGSVWSNFKQKYGFFEASIKAADTPSLNNAFWLVTDDKFEIDIVEVHYPSEARLTLHDNNHDVEGKHAVGFNAKYNIDLSRAFHDYGVLWTPTDIIYEIDGDPVAAIAIQGGAAAPANVRFSTALQDFDGPVSGSPSGHEMAVKSLRVVAL